MYKQKIIRNSACYDKYIKGLIMSRVRFKDERIVKIICTCFVYKCNMLLFVMVSRTDCSYPVNDDEHASISNWMPSNNSVHEGSIITYQCHDGFWYLPQLFEQDIMCFANGTWSTIGSCEGQGRI